MSFEELYKTWDQESKDWFDTRPPHVQEVIRKIPPDFCYRLKDTRGHYSLHSYSEHKDKTVTLKIVHLDDSWGNDPSPDGKRIMVFGIAPEDLIPCKCGKGELNGRRI